MTGDKRGFVKLWDFDTGRCLNTLIGKASRTMLEAIIDRDECWLSVAIGAAGSRVFCGSQNVEFWDVDQPCISHELRGHDDWITSMATSDDGKWLITGSLDQTARIWDVDIRKCVAVYCASSPVLSVADFFETGRAVCGTADGAVHMLQLMNIDAHQA